MRYSGQKEKGDGGIIKIIPPSPFSLMYMGDGKVDQTAQGVRFKGDFENNLVLTLGGTVRYDF